LHANENRSIGKVRVVVGIVDYAFKIINGSAKIVGGEDFVNLVWWNIVLENFSPICK